MAVYFGLNISRNLTDIQDATAALTNLNLDVEDLAVIKGITDPGNVTRSDFRTLSNLNFDLEKTLAAVYRETENYDNLITNVYDESSPLNCNLDVSGQFAATSIKYLYVDFADNNKIKSADISTSRVSSWSSFEIPTTSSSPIFYGNEVSIEGPLEYSELFTNELVEPVRFDSEIPTHRVKTTIGGETVYLYAMKSIPLIFRGFFRRAPALIAQVNVISGKRPSWVIKNTSNNLEYVYKNQLSNSVSTISFNDTVARERDISFYYPVDNITRLELPNVGIITFPDVVLPNLQQLNLNNNDFREIPDFSQFTNLALLNFVRNNLSRSQDVNLRLLNPSVVSRLPSSLRTLYLGNCYSGESTADFSAAITFTSVAIAGTSGQFSCAASSSEIYVGGVVTITGTFGGTGSISGYASGTSYYISATNGSTSFTLKTLSGNTLDTTVGTPTGLTFVKKGFDLTTFDIGTNWNERRLTGVAPQVKYNSIITYSIYQNAFSNLPTSIKNSTTLRYLNMSNNNMLANDISIYSPELIELYATDNRCNIIDVAGKTKLKVYQFAVVSVNGNSEITDVFNGCTSLQTVNLYYSTVTGSIPKFTNCTSLVTVDMDGTRVRDAVWESATSTNNLVLSDTTFDACRNTLSFFRVSSSNFSRYGTFSVDCLKSMKVLSYLLITSNKTGIAGQLPSFTTARNLQYVLLYNNFLEGTVEGIFNNCTNLFFLNLTSNLFTGPVPNIPSTALQHLILPYNNFNSFSTMLASNLVRIHLSFNKIPSIPDLSNLTKLQELLFNNQSPAGVDRVDYYPGAFAKLTAIRTINISNNNIAQGNIDRIIQDLNENYTKNPRSGVSINLKGNDAPSVTGDTPLTIKKLRAAGWTILTS